MVKLKRIHGHMMSNGGSFWDLGAGGGKLVIAAAMMHNFEVSYQARQQQLNFKSCDESRVLLGYWSVKVHHRRRKQICEM